MNRPSGRLFLASGGLALLCAPAILVAERLGWDQRPFHTAQLAATLACLLASIGFLRATRGEPRGWPRALAVGAALLSGLWLGLVGWVLLTFDLSGMG
ncbi:MAG: hypothetical protein ACYTG2_14025 [Planctomycetota bacterium]